MILREAHRLASCIWCRCLLYIPESLAKNPTLVICCGPCGDAGKRKQRKKVA